MLRFLLAVFVVGLVVNNVVAFKELNDGARIIVNKDSKNNNAPSSYSIPLREQRDATRVAGVLSKFDDDEFALISRMKTMETPPSPEAIDYYAQNKHVSSRFINSRVTRSLKFDEASSSSSSSSKSPVGPPALPSATQQRSINSGVSFDGDRSSPSSDKDKRIFPELFGFGVQPGYYAPHHQGLHHYPPPHHGYYPTGGYYPNNYGNGYYPGGGHHSGAYYPGFGNSGSSSAAAAAASSSSGGGYNRPGLYGNGYYGGGYGNYGNYGNGYYPPGGVTPILHGGTGYPGAIGYGGYPAGGGGGFLGGFFRDEEGGKGRANAKDKVEGVPKGGSSSVSFEK